MNFLQLLSGAEVLAQSGNPPITGIEFDSRCVKSGNAFVALKGETNDGNKFIDRALGAGAVAIVSDSPTETPRGGAAWARVLHGRRALARLSANFYGKPAERLAITGITGTNGKSTTAFLIESILNASGRKSSLVGTIEYHVAGKILSAPHTTPESLELNRMLAEAVGHGATESIMEVSSHALAQQRVYGIPFDVAVFTNLTQDHLDYHHTMDEYFASKRMLFDGCGTEAPRAAVLNVDNEHGQKLLAVSRKRSSEVFTYGLAKGEFHAGNVELTLHGTRLDVITPAARIPVFSSLIGHVNVLNILAAVGAAYARNCSSDAIAKGIELLSRVPGRFERIDCNQPFTVVVDYAHTPDALKNVTALARRFVRDSGQKGRVITLFGCGGDRDRAKRPLMAEAAGRGSDFVVLTSDNPRSEDPLAIINDALVGLQRSTAKYKTEPDRKAAIVMAIHEARPGDIVLLAGKGHEKVQVLRDRSIPFDDVEVAREILLDAGYDCATRSAVGGRAR